MPVLDRTGLKGFYEISLFVPGPPVRSDAPRAAEDNFEVATPGLPAMPAAADPDGVNIFKSIRRLGLKLEKGKAPIQHLIVEYAEQTPVEH